MLSHIYIPSALGLNIIKYVFESIPGHWKFDFFMNF